MADASHHFARRGRFLALLRISTDGVFARLLHRPPVAEVLIHHQRQPRYASSKRRPHFQLSSFARSYANKNGVIFRSGRALLICGIRTQRRLDIVCEPRGGG